MIRYATTAFVGAFLLFQIQPLVAKIILPWFGGSAAVWTACLLFFQMIVLAGYCYAHLIVKFSPWKQLAIHFGLLIVSLCFLPFQLNTSLRPEVAGNLTLDVVWVLGMTLGLPILALATTGPLIQAWHSKTHVGGATYRLYALSNIGSLCALLTYPFLFEPMLRLQIQVWSWTAGFVLFALFSAASCWLFVFKRSDELKSEPGDMVATDSMTRVGLGEPDKEVRYFDILVWVLLSFSAASVLMAGTNQICLEVASVPLLWVLPLTLYLTSFIICFDKPKWFKTWLFFPLMIASTFGAFFLLTFRLKLPTPFHIAGYSICVFACCMCCHGELEKSKPARRHLTLFYLAVSTGGALGGVFVSLIAPLVFKSYLEFELSVIFAIITSLFAFFRAPNEALDRGRWRNVFYKWLIVPLALTSVALMVAHPVIEVVKRRGANLIHVSRNSYGILRVYGFDDEDGNEFTRLLFNGSITHGSEVNHGGAVSIPNMYYGHHSGVGVAFEELRKRELRKRDSRKRDSTLDDEQKLKVGVIGLGVGTLAAWARPDEKFKFYEINPDVELVARDHFSYLNNALRIADVSVVIGDARIQLENEINANQSENFDLLVVDAFTSDAIPMHLMTRECFDLYASHTSNKGLIAFHISNRFLNLRPVTKGLDAQTDWTGFLFEDSTKRDNTNSSVWVLFCNDETLAAQLRNHSSLTPWSDDSREVIWTDDFGSIAPLFEWESLMSLFGGAAD